MAFDQRIGSLGALDDERYGGHLELTGKILEQLPCPRHDTFHEREVVRRCRLASRGHSETVKLRLVEEATEDLERLGLGLAVAEFNGMEVRLGISEKRAADLTPSGLERLGIGP